MHKLGQNLMFLIMGTLTVFCCYVAVVLAFA